MRTKNRYSASGFLKALQLAALGIAMGLSAAQGVAAQDLKHPPALEIFARPPAIEFPVLSASGEMAYYLSRKGNETSLTLHDLQAKTRSEIILTGLERAANGLRMIDDEHLAISYPLKSGGAGISTLDLTTRKLTRGGPATDEAPAHTGTQPLLGKDKRVLGQVTYGTWASYRFDDPELADLPTLAARAFEGYRVRFVDFAADPRKVVVMTEGDDDPGTYYFIDFAQDGFVQLGQTRPALHEEWISEKETFDYRAGDGLVLKAFVSLPPGRDPHGLPLIVLASSPDDHQDLGFDPFVAALTTRGYAVLQAMVRGTQGYGEALQAAGDGEWGGKALTDMSDAVTALKAADLIDDTRVCIIGRGLGGYQALAAAAFQPQQYRCAVDMAGISDLETYFAAPDAPLSDAKALFGPQSQWPELSPLNKAADVTASVLIIHPKDTKTVPAAQSRQMARALKDAGRDVTLNEPPVSPEVSFDANLKVFKLVVDFLLKANAPSVP